MKYLLYFVEIVNAAGDGFEDCKTVYSKKQLNKEISEMVASGNYKEIGYFLIYPCGEYSAPHTIYKKGVKI